MKLSVSNIAWAPEHDAAVFAMMQKAGCTGLEIAPTRILPDNPYDRISEAVRFAAAVREEYGFCVPSMQSIWFGRTEKVFGPPEERARLVSYTKKAVNFAEAIGCRNLVFGCPRHRVLPEGADPAAAVPFFREIAEYARAHHTVIALEANPPMYHTNFVNTTAEALELIREVGSEGFRLNLDIGTMIENGESVSVIRGTERLIHHVHLSEPGLGAIQKRPLHRELAECLRAAGYAGFVSLETGRCGDSEALKRMIGILAETFGS